jgi:hypothetical protein
VQITLELCKSNAELRNLVAKTSTAIRKWTNIFIVHQSGRNELAHTVAETLCFKPHQKYFHENVFFSRPFVKMTT